MILKPLGTIDSSSEFNLLRSQSSESAFLTITQVNLPAIILNGVL